MNLPFIEIVTKKINRGPCLVFKRIVFRRVAANLLLCLLVYHKGAGAEALPVSGWIETVIVGKQQVRLDAKVDTGATHSSIHAEELQFFDSEGMPWVRFTLKNSEGDSIPFDAPVRRIAQIKQTDKRMSSRRPVIMLSICLGKVYREVEVNLVDRSNFKYPMLIGKSFLQGSFVVDPGKMHITQPECNI